jgi:hypothetical protein
MSKKGSRDRLFGHMLATRTSAGVALELGNNRRATGQFGDLMPGGLRGMRLGLFRQGRVALFTDFGNKLDSMLNPVARKTKPLMTFVTTLAPAFAFGGFLGGGFRGGKRVLRGRNRGVGGVKPQTSAQFLNLLLEQNDLLLQGSDGGIALGTTRTTRLTHGRTVATSQGKRIKGHSESLT